MSVDERFRSSIEKLVQDANEILGDVIQKVRPSDIRARQAKSEWPERHRLLVLVEATEECLRRLPQLPREPWLLAELSGCLEVIRRWKDDLSWKEIKPSLADPFAFSHTVATLMLAERLREWGNTVELVPTGPQTSPDLRLRAIGGKRNWLYVECYHPRILSGKPVTLSTGDTYKITKQAKKKVRDQLGNEVPGILVICAYNQTKSNIDLLKQTIQTRLQQTSRGSLAGFILLSQNNMRTNESGNLSFTSAVSLDFVPNPAYFGSVDVSSDVSDGSTGVGLFLSEMREPVTEVIVNDFVILQQEMQRLSPPETDEATTTESKTLIQPKVEALHLLDGDPKERVIFTWSGDSYTVLLKSEGNINFECGNCNAIIAEQIWRLSCSNIVVECPKCKLYNEFPPQDPAAFMKTSNIAIEASLYRCTSTILMKRGACLIGVESGYHLRARSPDSPTSKAV